MHLPQINIQVLQVHVSSLRLPSVWNFVFVSIHRFSKCFKCFCLICSILLQEVASFERTALYNICWSHSLSYLFSMSSRKLFTIKESPSMNGQPLACRRLDFRLRSRILGMTQYSFISNFRFHKNYARVTHAVVVEWFGC